jgi:N-acetylglucosamine kinase-like BadF-type ATPase
MQSFPLIIGVDGGGTKTTAWIAPLDDAENTIVIGRGQAGPGNPRAAGFEIAQSSIAAAVEAAFADAKLPRAPAAAACFGLAGAGRKIEQRRIEAWAKEAGIAHAVGVCGDAEPILAAASPHHRGVALICGTGSLAWGRNTAGEVARSGGWGYLLGDEGSGYSIALAGLTAAVRAADGRGQPTMLLSRLLQALGAKAPQEMVERVYAAEMTRERLAGLCTFVFDAAPGDAVARTIIENAAEQLAEMVSALCHRLGMRGGEYPLALAGGVILNQPLLRCQLSERLERKRLKPGSICLVAEPVRGALMLARSIARTHS